MNSLAFQRWGLGGAGARWEVREAPRKLSVSPQSHQEQRGRAVPGGQRPLQLLQPQLAAALHPAPAHQQLGALQLRPPDGGAQPVAARLQGGPAELLQQPHGLHGRRHAPRRAL